MTSDPAPPPAAARSTSLDAFRGAILLLMASGGFGLTEIARNFPGSGLWGAVGRHCEHAEWQGCTLWDLIQPAFMFMAGIALPWSVANRQARGQSFGPLLGHALRRALLLILIAVFLSSAWSRQTEWVFFNVLAQIGLAYPFLFILAFTGRRTPWVVAVAVLLISWLAFALYPLPPADAVSAPHLHGFAAHWEKNHNVAAAFDQWFLNLFPRPTVFTSNSGGYQTLNFVPSLVTMIGGLLAGRLLRRNLPLAGKLGRLVIAGCVCIALGLILDRAGICPIVKRIWTPGWVLYSGGWVTLGLAGFVAVIDGFGWKRPAFPLVVAGLNPITLYCVWQLSGGFLRQQVRTHFGKDIFASFGEMWSPLTERVTILALLWLLVWWMWRRRIFLRV